MSTILALDISGVPRAWVAQDDAISYHAKNLVAWSLGEVIARYNGGYCKNGIRSYLETPSIIAIRGESFDFNKGANVSRSGSLDARIISEVRSLYRGV